MKRESHNNVKLLRQLPPLGVVGYFNRDYPDRRCVMDMLFNMQLNSGVWILYIVLLVLSGVIGYFLSIWETRSFIKTGNHTPLKHHHWWSVS
jgi:hypothetical protein